MRKILALLLILTMIVGTCGCAEVSKGKTLKSELIAMQALELLIEHWRSESLSDFDGADKMRIEVVNTKVYHIKDDLDEKAKKYFGDVECVVEFAMYINYFRTDKYEILMTIGNSVTVYEDGSMKVNDLFITVKGATLNPDMIDNAIDRVENLGDKCNGVYKLFSK